MPWLWLEGRLWSAHIRDAFRRLLRRERQFYSRWLGVIGLEIESDGANQSVKVIDDTLVEAIELGAPVMLETGLGPDWA